MTRVQWAGAAVGVAIALSSIAAGPAVAGALRLVGYPVAVVVIVRWVPVVRDRLASWFVLHQAGMAAIVAGWALVPRWGGVAVNGAWFVIAAAWYGWPFSRASRRRASPGSRRGRTARR